MENDPKELSPRQIFEHILPEMAKRHIDITRSINAVLAIELTGENGGSWSLDLTGEPRSIQGLSDDARCVIRMEADRFSDLLKTRKITPWLSAFTKRKINVSGDMPTVIKLGQLLTNAVKDESK